MNNRVFIRCPICKQLVEVGLSGWIDQFLLEVEDQENGGFSCPSCDRDVYYCDWQGENRKEVYPQ